MCRRSVAEGWESLSLKSTASGRSDLIVMATLFAEDFVISAGWVEPQGQLLEWSGRTGGAGREVSRHGME